MESKNKDLSSSDNPAPVPPIKDLIIDLPKLSMQSEIRNSDIILAILEICTFNKKYNYDCSNNTKAFWDRVVQEGILKKIFKNFKSETLRKYWKIIRNAGNTEKFVEAVRKNEKFINNPVFKLLPLINALAYYIQTDEKDFEVANGGAALTAYNKLMFCEGEGMNDALRQALLRYCELDTMSMVFIWEYFYDMVTKKKYSQMPRMSISLLIFVGTAY